MEAFKENGIYTEVIKNIKKKRRSTIRRRNSFCGIRSSIEMRNTTETFRRWTPLFLSNFFIFFLIEQTNNLLVFFFGISNICQKIFSLFCVLVKAFCNTKKKISKAKENFNFLLYILSTLTAKQATKQVHRYTDRLWRWIKATICVLET